MMLERTNRVLASLIAVAATLMTVGCAARDPNLQPRATTTASASAPQSERHVYRFDFVLSTIDDKTSAPTKTSFTLNIAELEKGEVTLGKNVLIPSAPSGNAVQSSMARQDVGTKVWASYRTKGDDVFLETGTEMSTLELPSTIRKAVMRGTSVVVSGKPAVVSSFEDERGRAELSVTATKLR